MDLPEHYLNVEGISRFRTIHPAICSVMHTPPDAGNSKLLHRLYGNTTSRKYHQVHKMDDQPASSVSPTERGVQMLSLSTYNWPRGQTTRGPGRPTRSEYMGNAWHLALVRAIAVTIGQRALSPGGTAPRRYINRSWVQLAKEQRKLRRSYGVDRPSHRAGQDYISQASRHVLL
ncbi:hypothetical protein BDW42DRAFT_171353 [Aspergillus taichungensis]|uniref:Uncharacterized protein n=1 Tax=Aspergillus taichungensis TaxID=482145 RepID=A0A2J5HS86_9EURO|nr:hypothetical protein BDW42DRAFT_171353 [Aspergillus taichungensis]